MELLELVRKLVSFNTASTDRKQSTVPISNFLIQYLKSMNFKVRRYVYEEKGIKSVNLLAQKGGDGLAKLALSGHMDTVGGGKFKLSNETNNKFSGRGVVDMKSFLAIAIKAAETINEESLKYPFALCFTSDEEIGCLGAKKLLRESNVVVAENIIIGEPTELIPIFAHKGYCHIRIELFGESAHSSDPSQGKNIIPALLEVFRKLQTLKNKLNQIKDHRFTPPYPTINIGKVTTDRIVTEKIIIPKYLAKILNAKKSDKRNEITDAIELVNKKSQISIKNKIPSYCLIELDIRPVPGQSGNKIFDALKANLGDKIGDIEVKINFVRSPTPAMETPIDCELVEKVEKISGKKIETVSFNTEGGLFNKSGSRTLVWGPGSIKQAHKEDEYIDSRYLTQEVVDMYANIIKKMCYR
jgi:acetylornithine deacetylase